MTTAPYHWVKKIEHAIEDLKVIPLWGTAPSFPWEAFSQQLAQLLNIDQVKVLRHQTDWKETKDLLSGMGAHPFIIPLDCLPLPGEVFWVMSSEDAAKAISFSLSHNQSHKPLLDARFQEGYYHFLSLEVLNILDQQKAFGDLNVIRRTPTPLPANGAICIDIVITIKQETLWGRVIASQEFIHNFRAHFVQKKASLLSNELIKQINVPLRFEIGSVSLNLYQWQKAKVGDFVILDRCSFDPEHRKGTAKVLLEKAPLFQVRIKENTIKILEEAYYEEDTRMMDTPFSDDEEKKEEEEDFSEEEFSLSEDEEMPDQERPSEHLWSSKNDDSPPESLISQSEIPLVLTVEVAKIRMSLEKILQLQPGNVLELSVLPEEGVDLTISGKKVAKGELIKIGDVLGIKILRLGE
jgi:flagellar motor switch protein FliN/FliY